MQAQAFATLQRSAKTTVVVGDSDTIVIGGLIRDKIQESVNKIPILGDIPVLGWLFKSKTSQVDKTNLVVFMTPHIVRQYEKVRAILDRKLKERDDFLESNAGGEDPDARTRDEMIRSLPDIKELTNKKPQDTVTIDEDDRECRRADGEGNPFTGGAPGAAGAPTVMRRGASAAGGQNPGSVPPLQARPPGSS